MPTSPPTRIPGSHTHEPMSDTITARLRLEQQSLVVELASNDGYLLQYFLGAKTSPSSGSSRQECCPDRDRKGYSDGDGVLWRRAGTSPCRGGRKADLLLGNNVLAHVPDINDFVAGMKILLKPRGCHHDGVSAPRPADRGKPVRHHLSRALFLSLFYHGRGNFLLRMAWRSSTSKNCRPMAVRCASTRRHAEDDSKQSSAGGRELKKREAAWGINKLERYRGFRRKGRSHQTRHPAVPDRRQGERKVDRRLRRARERKHSAQLLRNPFRFSGLHG